MDGMGLKTCGTMAHAELDITLAESRKCDNPCVPVGYLDDPRAVCVCMYRRVGIKKSLRGVACDD